MFASYRLSNFLAREDKSGELIFFPTHFQIIDPALFLEEEWRSANLRLGMLCCFHMEVLGFGYCLYATILSNLPPKNVQALQA